MHLKRCLDQIKSLGNFFSALEICPFVSCDCPVYLGHLIQMHRHKEKISELRDSPGYIYLRCHLFGCSHRSLGLASRHSICIWTVNSYRLFSVLLNWFKLVTSLDQLKVYGPLRPKCTVHLISVHASQGGIKSTKDKYYCEVASSKLVYYSTLNSFGQRYST